MTEKPKHTLEQMFEIWNDKTGSRIQVGPDRDALGMIEIRTYCDDGSTGSIVLLDSEQAQLVAQALLHIAKRQP